MFSVPDCGVPGHQPFQLLMGWRLAQAGQHTQHQHQVFVGLNTVSLRRFYQRIHNSAGFCSLHTVTEQSVLSAYHKGPDRILCQIVGDRDIPIVQKCHELLLLV